MSKGWPGTMPIRAMRATIAASSGAGGAASPISRAIMKSSDRLRIVAKYTIGVDDVDVEAATELGILVTHSPTESNWGGVAEGTIKSRCSRGRARLALALADLRPGSGTA